jgi:hypothetical protein
LNIKQFIKNDEEKITSPKRNVGDSGRIVRSFAIGTLLLIGIVFLLFISCNHMLYFEDKSQLGIEKKQRDNFNNSIEKHYQKLISSFSAKDFDKTAKVIVPFVKFDSLTYKNVKNINKRLKNQLDKKVKKIPASNVSANLQIYEQLLSLDPSNERYKRKVGFYKSKFEAKQREAKKASVHLTEPKIIEPGRLILSTLRQFTYRYILIPVKKVWWLLV